MARAARLPAALETTLPSWPTQSLLSGSVPKAPFLRWLALAVGRRATSSPNVQLRRVPQTLCAFIRALREQVSGSFNPFSIFSVAFSRVLRR